MSRRPNPLPRGIEAFLPDPAPDTTREIALDRLEPNPFQPRRDLTALDDLVASIAEHGILQPILVRPHPADPARYQIIAGERRWRAAQRVPLHSVPIHIRPADDRAVAVIALVENLQREDLNPIDEAEGYARMLRDFSWTQEAVSAAVGRSRSHVANTLRLLNLPPPATAALRTGEITAGHARALLSHPDPAGALRDVIGKSLSVRETEALARRAADPPEPKPHDPDLDAVSARLSEALGLRITLAGTGARGTLSLRYTSLDQLDGLIALLMPG